VARVIAEAAVRLTIDRKGLATSIRREFREAVREATSQGSLFDDVDRDSDQSAKRVHSHWSKAFTGIRNAATGLGGALANIGKLLLVGTAAAGALAGIASLTSGVASLTSSLIAASGVAAILPAALLGIVAVSKTLKIGMSGVSDAMKAIGEDTATFNEAIKDLAPNAQDFVRALREQKGAFDQLKMDVQNRLFLGLADAVKPLAEKYLPLANRLFVTIAGSLNNAAQDIVKFAQSSQTVGKVGTIVDNIRSSFEGLSGAFAPAIAGLLDLTTVGSTFLPRLTSAISGASQRFAEFMKHAAESGQLEAFINNAIEVLKTLGRIISNVFGIFRNVLDAAQSQGTGLLGTLEKITGAIKEWTGSLEGQVALRTFFDSMGKVIDALGPAFLTLVGIIARDFVPILADIAQAIGPVLKPLFETFGRLLQALRPLIAAIADAFAVALEALGPFFDALGQAITDVMPTLAPVIKDIGRAFADLFKALAPLAPVFVELIAAILPIIPPLIDMITEIMPEIIDLIKALIPLIKAWIDMWVALLPIITDVVNFLLNVFVPVIQFVVWVISGIINIITTVFTTIWNVITTVLTAIGDFFVMIWDFITSTVSDAWNAIGDFFSGGISGIAQKIGQFATDLWNSFISMMRNVVSAVGTGIGNVVQWFVDLPGKVFSAIGDFIGRMIQLGKDLITGLWKGIKESVQKVIDAVTKLASDAIAAAKRVLGVASPSKVFRSIGQDLGRGLIGGLEAITPAVAAAAAAMAGVTTDPFGNPLAVGASTGAGLPVAAGGTVVNQTNIMRPGTDVKQFSDTVLGRGLGDFLSGASTLTVSRNGVQAGVNDQWVGVG
jgi:phage-related protein